jgi:hypothetical protein
MKRTLILSIIFIFGFFFPRELSAQIESYFTPVTDSIQNYSYNTGSGTWDFAGTTYYFYNSGLIDSAVTTDNSRMSVSKTIYLYAGGNFTEALTQVFNSGSWVPSQDQVLYYDSENILNERIVTKWTAGQWQNLNRFTYFYNNSLLTVYNREMWRNNSWTDFSADSLFYDENDFLIERSARLKSSGEYVTRQLYEYDIYGRRLYMTRQDYINNEWINVSRSNSLYDKCRNQSGSLNDMWDGYAWQQSSKSVVFYHYEYDLSLLPNKVPVCHDGTTIIIKKTVLPTHLAHGDCPGECFDSKGSVTVNEEPSVQKNIPPFVVYPNPAAEWLNIRLTDNECPVSRIELLDFNGRVVRSVNPGEQTEVTLDLSNIISGNYILRITSDTVYSTVISRK